MDIFSKDPPHVFMEVQESKTYDWDEIISLVDRVAELEKKVVSMEEEINKMIGTWL